MPSDGEERQILLYIMTGYEREEPSRFTDWRFAMRRGLDGLARAVAPHPALAPAHLQCIGAALAPEFAIAAIALT